ncbi:MAG: nucleoside monophosphate kinase [Spirochaetia bacterium]|jgi:adenylate kinase family enzyme|nr:nucleoside monophosphate kinase [Spirochaetia bacterium]
MDKIYKAILLLGPTGTGKTPLGQQLETRGLWWKSYHHFDFGEELRRVSSLPGKTSSGDHSIPASPASLSTSGKSAGTEGGSQVLLTGKELETINNVLENNTLLKDEDFSIAEKLLTSFIREKIPGTDTSADAPEDVIILNGLPRHTGQAKELSKIVDVRLVIMLDGHPDIIKERIKLNSGGDRRGRTDDSEVEIERKLEIYKKQTKPLVEYYKKLDRTILEIEVEIDTIPLYIIQGLETMPNLI